MTVSELYSYLSGKIPASLSCEWDNDGLMCCPNGKKEVKKVLLALDVTSDVVEEAISRGCEVIISHHPFIFKPLSAIDGESTVSALAIRLICAGVAVFSFHTRLDALSGGVNDSLAALLGVQDALPFGDEQIGRVGVLPAPMELSDFAALVKERLGAPYVNFSDAGKRVERVALLGGAGKGDIFLALSAGADTFVSGELGYHALMDAPDGEINLIEAGHFFTEDHVLDVLCGFVKEADASIAAERISSYRIKTL